MMAIAKFAPHSSRSDFQIARFCSQNLALLTVCFLLILIWCYSRAIHSKDDATTHSTTTNNDREHLIARNGSYAAVELITESEEFAEAMRREESAPRLESNLSMLSLNGTGQERRTILHRRVKRGVLDLASMLKCVTGCNPFMYKDYGCYCGFQGDGFPVDGIDRCCYMHDYCYSRVACHQAMVYFKPYKWACMGYGRARCGLTSSSLCALQLCECDRKFAKCLTRYRCPHSKASCDSKSINIIFGK